jgi:hypothetical protein
MKTTNEGFLVNTLRRLPRHGVKALAAGAVLIAAALPLALGSAAGATTIASVNFNTTSGSHGNGSQSGTAAWFGTGASGTVTITGSSDFADSGGTVTVSSTAPGVTFSGAAEVTDVTTASFSSTSATVPGSYTLTVTDSAGASTGGTFTVNSAPSFTSQTLTTLADNPSPSPVADVVTGAGFEGTNLLSDTNSLPTVAFTSAVDGTHLTVGTVTGGGTETLGYYSSLDFTVEAVNPVNSAAATAGAYTETITNGDGGTVSIPNAFTVTAAPVSTVSPSALPLVTASTSYTVTVAGSGFQPGAVVSLSAGCGTDGITVDSTTFVSSTSVTALLTDDDTATTTECDVTVANSSPGDNGASNTLANGLGIGQASEVAPTITASSATTAVVAGAPAGTITFTGAGFSMYTAGGPDSSSLGVFEGTSTTSADNAVAILSGPSGNSGTSITYTLSVPVGTTAGPDSVVLANDGVDSAAFAAAFTVAGPVVSSQTPADLATGAPAGTIVTLTGTGFTPATTGTFTNGGGGGTLNGVIQYVNATTMDFVVTTAPNTSDITQTNPDFVTLTQVQANGTEYSTPFDLTIGYGPTVTSAVTYATGTNVGVGAKAQTVIITGTHFNTGVKVGSFVNANSVADPAVTATVVSVNAAGTQITATIAITAPDANIADGYTVTNTDGGSFSVSAATYPILIGAAPTVTTVAPATATANSTVAFTLTGTGFASGASVAATADGTCGTATVVSATSITVSCTFGPAVSAAALAVTNANGGSVTTATVLAAGATTAGGAPHATSESGNGVVGKTVHIAVVGVGFYGQPSVTSTGNSVKAVVSFDNGTRLTVVVSVGKTTGAGEHTLTFTLANGKVFKVNYKIVK